MEVLEGSKEIRQGVCRHENIVSPVDFMVPTFPDNPEQRAYSPLALWEGILKKREVLRVDEFNIESMQDEERGPLEGGTVHVSVFNVNARYERREVSISGIETGA